jgi:probable rRNA maturation factor
MDSPGDSRGNLLSDPAEPAADAEPPQWLQLTIVEEDGDWRSFGSLEEILRHAAAALAQHPRVGLGAGSTASIVLGSDALLQRLNATYRGKDSPTNVLSFPYQLPPGAPDDAGYLGDVLLAAETVRREAGERGVGSADHLQHLVVHGLLHLLGHDHLTEDEASKMENLETEILAAIGVADPYAAAAAVP